MPDNATDSVNPVVDAGRRPGLLKRLGARLSTPEGVFLGLIALYLLFTRLWNLGLKPVQHDESMFAYYSWLILDKYELMPATRNPITWLDQVRRSMAGYNFLAILHGPVLQWVTSMTFLACKFIGAPFGFTGDSDYTMRLPQALCSLGIIAFVYRWRGRIGRGPSNFAVLFLALCPSFTYLSRFIRPDMIMLFVYFLIFALGWRYREKPTAGRLLALVLGLWFGSAVHETYFIVMFFLITFGFGCWIHGTYKAGRWLELLIGFGLVGLLLADAVYVIKSKHYLVGLLIPAAVLLWLMIDGIRRKGDYPDIPFYREFRKAIWPHGWVVVAGSVLGFLMTVTFYTSFFSQYHPKDKEGKEIGPVAHLRLARADYDKKIEEANKAASDPAQKKVASTAGFLKEYLDTHFKHWDGQLESYRYWEAESKKHRIIGHFHYHWVIMSLYELPMFAFWVLCMVCAAWPRGGLPGARRNQLLFIIFAGVILAWAFFPMSWFPKGLIPKDADPPGPGTFFWNWKLADLRDPIDDKYHITWGFHIIAYVVSLTTIFVVGWKWLNRGQYFRSWIDYLTVGSFLAFGYAGEKVPWVTSHIAISMMISCGFYAWDIWKHLFDRSEPASAAGSVEPKEKRRSASKVASGGPGLIVSVGRFAFPAFLVISMSYAAWITYVSSFRQPGSPLERHSYASSHDEFHAATRWIIRQVKAEEAEKVRERTLAQQKKGERVRVSYETPIAMQGTQEWPLFWIVRRFKNRTSSSIPSTVKAEYVWVANDVMDKLNAEKVQQGGEHWTDRYVWVRKKFRHYWTPVEMDWRALLPGGTWEAPLTPQEAEVRKKWTPEQWGKWRKDRQKVHELGWNRLYNTFILRDEEKCAKDKGPFEWKWIGGYDVFFGKLRRVQPGAVPPAPAAAAPSTLPPGVAGPVAPGAVSTGAMSAQQIQELIQKSIKVQYVTATPGGTPSDTGASAVEVKADGTKMEQAPASTRSPVEEAPAAEEGAAPAAP